MRPHADIIDRLLHELLLVEALIAQDAPSNSKFDVVKVFGTVVATDDKCFDVDWAKESLISSRVLNALNQQFSGYVEVLIIRIF